MDRTGLAILVRHAEYDYRTKELTPASAVTIQSAANRIQDVLDAMPTGQRPGVLEIRHGRKTRHQQTAEGLAHHIQGYEIGTVQDMDAGQPGWMRHRMQRQRGVTVYVGSEPAIKHALEAVGQSPRSVPHGGVYPVPLPADEQPAETALPRRRGFLFF